MGNLKERESRRKASVVGSIIERQPAEETKQRSVGHQLRSAGPAEGGSGAAETGELVCAAEPV